MNRRRMICQGWARQGWAIAALWGVFFFCAETISAGSFPASDITPAQRAEARRLQSELGATEKLIRQDKFAEAAERAKATLEALDALVASGDEDVVRLVKSHYRRLQSQRTRLMLEGFSLPPVGVPGEAEETIPENATSFAKQVAPILISKCGRCHVSRASGGVSLADFATILQGPREGKILFAGNADGSRLIEVIVEGDMPRGGGRVSDEELATLKAWINEGAKYDADDRNANLASLIPDGAGAAPQRPEVVMSAGTESVSFATDIAPVLMENCRGCHIVDRNPRGGLNLSDFRRLIRGGDSGAIVVPGQPDESLLIKKLEGTADGNRMPQGRPPLNEEIIKKFRTWVAEGATFDGGDAGQPIETVVAIARAQSATHEELAAERLKIAEQNWDLAMPNIDHATVTSGDYVVLGNLDDADLQRIGERAQDVERTVGQLFKARDRDPIVKGRMTFFVFRSRYDYSEFGQMVEKRQLPDAWKGHWRFNVIDAYGVFLMPRNDEEYSLDAMLAQQISGAHLASLGADIPDWFAEGGARVAAARVARDDPRVVGWLEALPAALGRFKKADDFMTGGVAPEDAQLASYSFVEFLMSDARRFTRLMSSLKKGEAFEDSFATAYGGTPKQLTTLWANALSRGGRRR